MTPDEKAAPGVTVAATEFAPVILTNAGLAIGTPAVQLACVLNHIELSPDVAVTTLDTMCGSKDYPGTVKWSLIATLYQSFDTGATEDTLSAAVLAGVPVAFEVMAYRDVAVGPTNPKWTGEAIPQPYAPINGDAGAESSIDLEWSIVGAPVKVVA